MRDYKGRKVGEESCAVQGAESTRVSIHFNNERASSYDRYLNQKSAASIIYNAVALDLCAEFFIVSSERNNLTLREERINVANCESDFKEGNYGKFSRSSADGISARKKQAGGAPENRCQSKFPRKRHCHVGPPQTNGRNLALNIITSHAIHLHLCEGPRDLV